MVKKNRMLSKLKDQIVDLEVKRIMEMSDEEIMTEAIWEYGSPANAQKAINRLCQGINAALGMRGIKPIAFQAMTCEAPKNTITVCSKCLMASCWQGIFMCDDAWQAATVEKTISELEELKLEHPDYWKQPNSNEYRDNENKS